MKQDRRQQIAGFDIQEGRDDCEQESAEKIEVEDSEDQARDADAFPQAEYVHQLIQENAAEDEFLRDWRDDGDNETGRRKIPEHFRERLRREEEIDQGGSCGHKPAQ